MTITAPSRDGLALASPAAGGGVHERARDRPARLAGHLPVRRVRHHLAHRPRHPRRLARVRAAASTAGSPATANRRRSHDPRKPARHFAERRRSGAAAPGCPHPGPADPRPTDRQTSRQPRPGPGRRAAVVAAAAAPLRASSRAAKHGWYAPHHRGAPSTTRQAEILNTALIGPPTGTAGIVNGRDSPLPHPHRPRRRDRLQLRNRGR